VVVAVDDVEVVELATEGTVAIVVDVGPDEVGGGVVDSVDCVAEVVASDVETEVDVSDDEVTVEVRVTVVCVDVDVVDEVSVVVEVVDDDVVDVVSVLVDRDDDVVVPVVCVGDVTVVIVAKVADVLLDAGVLSLKRWHARQRAGHNCVTFTRPPPSTGSMTLPHGKTPKTEPQRAWSGTDPHVSN